MKRLLLLIFVMLLLVGCEDSNETVNALKQSYESTIETLMLENDELMTGIKRERNEIKKLTEVNRNLVQENESLKAKENQQVSIISMALEDNEKYVFIVTSTVMRLAPVETSYKVVTLEKGYFVKVLDKMSVITLEDSKVWYYVEITTNAEPVNTKGWLPVSAVMTRDLVERDQVVNVGVVDGSPIYPVDQVEAISHNTRTFADETYGYVEKTEGEYVFLLLNNGGRCWVKPEYIFIEGLDE